MALRLAGERTLAIQGTDNQGWVREVAIQDSLPGLKINQNGAGRVFDFQDGGASKMYLPDGGNVMVVGSLVFDLANDVTITPANPAAPRTLNIPDPGSDDTFAFLAAAQTLTGKTIAMAGPLSTASGDLIVAPAAGVMVGLAASYPAADTGKLHVWSGSAGSIASRHQNGITIEDNLTGGVGYEVLFPDNGLGELDFGTPTGGNYYHALIGFGPTHATQPGIMSLRAAGQSRLFVSTGGVISTIDGAPANVTEAGAVIAAGGVAFTDVANAHIDDATHGTGTVSHYIGNQTINTTSDKRLKKDIEPSKMEALEVLGKLQVVDYNWAESYGAHKAYNQRGRWTGILAQQAIEVVPFIINASGGENCARCLAGQPCANHGDWFVQYEHMVPVLVKALQEADSNMTAITSHMATLEAQLDLLQKAI